MGKAIRFMYLYTLPQVQSAYIGTSSWPQYTLLTYGHANLIQKDDGSLNILADMVFAMRPQS